MSARIACAALYPAATKPTACLRRGRDELGRGRAAGHRRHDDRPSDQIGERTVSHHSYCGTVTVPAAGWAAEAADSDRALPRVGTAARAASEKAYLKSDLDFAGAGVPAIRALVARWSKARPALHHDQVTGLVTPLWTSPLYECRQAPG